MFVIYDKEENRVPIKVWLNDRSEMDDGCYNQAMNLSRLPFIHKWVSLMPDTHMGKGMPIGGVIATEGVVIPNAVGVDIGCGMAFIETNIDVKVLNKETGSGTILKTIVGSILRDIPVGFSHFKKVQECKTIDMAKEKMSEFEEQQNLIEELEDGYYQVGTLGGGNHFMELQEDENGKLCIMLHSGSRHFGFKICDYFHKKARELNEKWYSDIPQEYNLPFLPVNSQEGKSYIAWMNLALDFAEESRDKMLDKIIEIVTHNVSKNIDTEIEFKHRLNCHHNYAAIENHYGKNVWVHRKGAIRARNGELGIIPGAMGANSYIVMGLGNEESFYSCSHGAGRRMSRKEAMKSFTVEEVMNDLKKCNVVLGKNGKKDVPEESRFAYKDIESVIQNQKDLVIPVKKLKTIGVVKG